MVNVVTANELKVKGVSILEKITSVEDEAIITVRGKNKYVVLSIDEYNHLRECEIGAALIETQNDLRVGNISGTSVKEHIKRMKHG